MMGKNNHEDCNHIKKKKASFPQVKMAPCYC